MKQTPNSGEAQQSKTILWVGKRREGGQRVEGGRMCGGGQGTFHGKSLAGLTREVRLKVMKVITSPPLPSVG